jgi:hypothetical protein
VPYDLSGLTTLSSRGNQCFSGRPDFVEEREGMWTFEKERRSIQGAVCQSTALSNIVSKM